MCIRDRSYLEHPQWDYKRVKGLGDVQLNDIVVFNFPAGDTVATGVPNDDVYRPVSYTHLDVYKRQATRRLLPFSWVVSVIAPRISITTYFSW